MTTQHDELDRINMPALSERALCQRLINENLSYVQHAVDQLNSSKEKHPVVRTFMSIDVVVDARDLLTVADEMGMLPPNLKARIPVEPATRQTTMALPASMAPPLCPCHAPHSCAGYTDKDGVRCFKNEPKL